MRTLLNSLCVLVTLTFTPVTSKTSFIKDLKTDVPFPPTNIQTVAGIPEGHLRPLGKTLILTCNVECRLYISMYTFSRLFGYSNIFFTFKAKRVGNDCFIKHVNILLIFHIIWILEPFFIFSKLLFIKSLRTIFVRTETNVSQRYILCFLFKLLNCATRMATKTRGKGSRGKGPVIPTDVLHALRQKRQTGRYAWCAETR